MKIITNINDPNYTPLKDLESFHRGAALARINQASLIVAMIKNGWTTDQLKRFLEVSILNDD